MNEVTGLEESNGDSLLASKQESALSHADLDFVHKPLGLSQPTIRVLQIQPGLSKDVIRCALKHIPREQDTYFCLSYMWGDETDSQYILVNGKRLKVRLNLYTFLELARKFKINDWLWIDAVSIDQSNVMERNHQVQQMAKIYRDAKHVLISPGHICRKLCTVAKFVSRSDLWYLRMKRKALLRRLLKAELVEAARQPYWGRLWIVQEILLAQERFVVTQSGLIPWSGFCVLYSQRGFRSAVTELDSVDNRDWAMSVLAHLCKETSRYRPSPRTLLRTRPPLDYDFEDIFMAFRSARCSDVRDRIYGMLGLVSRGSAFKIDYEKSPEHLLLDTLQHFEPKYAFADLFPKFVYRLSSALGVRLRLLCVQCTVKKHPDKCPQTNPYAMITIKSQRSLKWISQVPLKFGVRCAECRTEDLFFRRSREKNQVRYIRVSEEELLFNVD